MMTGVRLSVTRINKESVYVASTDIETEQNHAEPKEPQRGPSYSRWTLIVRSSIKPTHPDEITLRTADDFSAFKRWRPTPITTNIIHAP
jgi:hypothetical protein